MRLWHYDLIPYLPKQQLLGQWRELNSIYVKQDNHILINFIYNHPDVDLLVYSQFIIQEMISRGYKYNLNNYYNYFKNKNVDLHDVENINLKWIFTDLFKNDMNKIYLKICCWNLYEKYIRGQTGFTDEALIFINRNMYTPN